MSKKQISKLFYWDLIKDKEIYPANTSYWKRSLPEFQLVDEKFWEKIYKNVYSVTASTSLQSFQYKIIHNIINCNKKLFDWKVVNDYTCTYCTKESMDDLLHYFVLCPRVFSFWKMVIKWWNKYSNLTINCNDKYFKEYILFGFPNHDEHFECLNYTILICKLFIYLENNNKSNRLFISNFLKSLSYNLKIEYIVNKKEQYGYLLEHLDPGTTGDEWVNN